MKRKKRTKYFIFFILFYTFVCKTQSEIKSIGIYGSTAYKYLNYNFNKLADVPRPDIPLTENKFRPLFELGLNADYKFNEKWSAGIGFSYIRTKFSFTDLETVTVIVNRQPVKATLQDNLDINFNWFSPELFVTYMLSDKYNISAGTDLMWSYKTNFTQSQKFLNFPDVILINPLLTHSGNLKNTSKPLIMPFIRLSYDNSRFQYSRFRIIPSLEYALSLNNLTNNQNWKMQNIKASLKIAYLPQKIRRNLRFDTIYVRDTILNYSFKNKAVEITKFSTDFKTREIKNDSLLTYQTTINEIYETFIPKPKSIINCELKASFITDNSAETEKMKIVYSKVINNFRVFSDNSEKFKQISDTSIDIKIPNLKLRPQVITEAGLDSWNLSLSSNNKKIFEQKGILEIPDQFIINLDSIIQIKDNFEFSYLLTITDIDGQKIDCSKGIVISKEKEKSFGQNINNYLLIKKEIFSKAFLDRILKNRSFASFRKNNTIIISNDLNSDDIIFNSLKSAKVKDDHFYKIKEILNEFDLKNYYIIEFL